MQFDAIIMNSPYNFGSKVTSETILHLENKGVCSCLMPIGRLSQYLSYNRPVDNFGNLEDFNIRIQSKINELESQRVFGLSNIGADLGIWLIKNGNFNKYNLCKDIFGEKYTIIQKLSNKIKELPKLKNYIKKFNDIKEQYILKLVYGLSLNNHGLITPSSFNLCSRNYETAIKSMNSNHTRYLEFKTENELKNAHSLYCSVVLRFIYKEILLGNCDYNFIPYFDFSQNYTDENLYDFFNISDDEKMIISTIMKPYI